jgi:2'-5' RNA ligase
VAESARRRLFIAVPIPTQARASIDALVAALREGAPDLRAVRWVRGEGLHLTLRFLGWTDPDRAARVSSIVADVAARQAPFDVTITGGGAFPSLSRPRVLWLDVTDGADLLAALEAELSEPLATLGWPPEARPYRAHLTLGRTDGSPAARATAAQLSAAAANLRVAVRATELVVMESHLGGGPARYEPFATARLAGPLAASPAGPVGSRV